MTLSVYSLAHMRIVAVPLLKHGQLLSIREKKMVMKANSKSMLRFWLILRHQMLEMGI